MAAASSSRRLASLLFRNRSRLSIPRGSPLPCRTTNLVRGFQRLNEAKFGANREDDDAQGAANVAKQHVSGLPQALNPAEKDANANIRYSASSSLKASARHDLAMIFTCKVCETRSVKTVCRESYEKGVVLARCGGCNNIHLIADRLGWFGQPGSVEDFLAARGEEVVKGSADTLNLTLDDLVGNRTC